MKPPLLLVIRICGGCGALALQSGAQFRAPAPLECMHCHARLERAPAHFYLRQPKETTT